MRSAWSCMAMVKSTPLSASFCPSPHFSAAVILYSSIELSPKDGMVSTAICTPVCSLTAVRYAFRSSCSRAERMCAVSTTGFPLSGGMLSASDADFATSGSALAMHNAAATTSFFCMHNAAIKQTCFFIHAQPKTAPWVPSAPLLTRQNTPWCESRSYLQ